jgi:hypothetical protein
MALEQPVHGGVQVVLIGIGHAEVIGQRRGVPPAGGGEFRVGCDDARGNHRQHLFALATGLGGDQRGEPQALHRRGDGLHMAVRARACDLKGLCQRYEGLTLQRATDDLDQRLGQVREVAQRLVLDSAALAVAAS